MPTRNYVIIQSRKVYAIFLYFILPFVFDLSLCFVASARDAIAMVSENKKWLDLRDKYFVLLGAGSGAQ